MPRKEEKPLVFPRAFEKEHQAANDAAHKRFYADPGYAAALKQLAIAHQKAKEKGEIE